MSAPAELMHFLALSPEDQAAAIRRLASEGMSVWALAAAARLSVEQVRAVLRNDAGRSLPHARSGDRVSPYGEGAGHSLALLAHPSPGICRLDADLVGYRSTQL